MELDRMVAQSLQDLDDEEVSDTEDPDLLVIIFSNFHCECKAHCIGQNLLIINMLVFYLSQSELQELSTNEPEPPQHYSAGPPPAKRASPQPPHSSGMYPCTTEPCSLYLR